MNTVTLNNVTLNLSELIAATISKQTETVIETKQGVVVMVEQNNWNSILETLRLLKDKKSLKALLDGHHERKKGKSPKGKTPEELFDDL